MPNRRSSLVAGRLLVAIAIGLACSVAAPLSCHAQETGIAPRHSSVYRPSVLLPLAAGLGYVGGIWDHDSGGYKDSFRFAPDKQSHLLASVVLAKAVADGTSVKVGLATCLLAGAAWEAGQRRHGGFASTYDMSYDAGGCVIGALWGRK